MAQAHRCVGFRLHQRRHGHKSVCLTILRQVHERCAGEDKVEEEAHRSHLVQARQAVVHPGDICMITVLDRKGAHRVGWFHRDDLVAKFRKTLRIHTDTGADVEYVGWRFWEEEAEGFMPFSKRWVRIARAQLLCLCIVRQKATRNAVLSFSHHYPPSGPSVGAVSGNIST